MAPTRRMSAHKHDAMWGSQGHLSRTAQRATAPCSHSQSADRASTHRLASVRRTEYYCWPGRDLGWERWHPSAPIASCAPVGRPAWVSSRKRRSGRVSRVRNGVPLSGLRSAFMQVLGVGGTSGHASETLRAGEPCGFRMSSPGLFLLGSHPRIFPPFPSPTFPLS